MSARKHDDIFLRHEGRRTDKLYVTGSSVANNLVKNVDQTHTSSNTFIKIRFTNFISFSLIKK